MASAYYNDKELREILAELFEHLCKQGARLNKDRKNDVIDGVMTSIKEMSIEFSKDDLKRDGPKSGEILKTLKAALVGEEIKKEFGLKYSHPFAKLCRDIVKSLSSIEPKPEPPKSKLQLFLEEIKKLCRKGHSKDKKDANETKADKKNEHKPAHDAIDIDASTATINNHYSVDRFGNWSYATVVLCDFIGLTNFSRGGTDKSAMGRRATAEDGQYDYIGIEATTIDNVISIAGVTPELVDDVLRKIAGPRNVPR